MENSSITSQKLREAIAMFPTLRAFADALNVKYQVVQQWLINGVPAEYCPTIELITRRHVRCEDLRPDINWSVVRSSDEVFGKS